MKLFFDEDMGANVPLSLKRIKMPCDGIVYPVHRGIIPLGAPDTEWLPWVGDNGYLAISANKKILEEPSEFELIIRHGVGIVFLDNGEYPLWQQMKWLMSRWKWLDAMDRTEDRPFAYIARVPRSAQRYDLSRGPKPPRPYRSPPSYR